MNKDFIAVAPDVYENEQGFIPGENGDYSGSPMIYPQLKRETVDLAPANNDVAAQNVQVSPDSASNQQNNVAQIIAATPINQGAEQKKWWEVIALLGDTAAKVYAAKKTGQLLPEGTYTESVEDKKISWVWIAVAVVLIFLLAYFTFKNGK